MIKKLRLRLILASMLSLLIVLSIIIGVANILNYNGIVRDADSVLSILRKTDGVLPERPEDIPWQSAGDRYRSPELPFEIRFFSAVVDESGKIISSYTDKIRAIDEEMVSDYAEKAGKNASELGFIGRYRYLRYEKGETKVFIFLDCGRQIASFRNGLKNTLLVSLLGYVAVFVLIYLLSRKIVHPFQRNYENQKRFITDAGHELKTPITIIDADSELLGLEIGDNEWLSDISLQTRRLSELTQDLISLSYLEERAKPEMIEFPVSDILLETTASFHSRALSAGKRLETKIQPGLSMQGNEKNVCQLATILLDNALKYANAGGSICFSLEKRGHSVVMACENTVESISKETLQNMFERFYRADASRTQHTSGGYGIGLSIARAIVEAHHGRIDASRSAAGAVVIAAHLPVRQRSKRFT